jgi:hypothetical protein
MKLKIRKKKQGVAVPALNLVGRDVPELMTDSCSVTAGTAIQAMHTSGTLTL